jgi:hypothetical protein
MGKIFRVYLDEYKLLRIEYYRVRYIHVVGKIDDGPGFTLASSFAAMVVFGLDEEKETKIGSFLGLPTELPVAVGDVTQNKNNASIRICSAYIRETLCITLVA